jgi:hypothetical protein
MSSNQYIPKGSYLITSRSVSVTINASCRQSNGNVVPSSLSFSQEEASKIRDIANIEGKLTVFTSDSPEPNPTTNLGPYVPAGSYQLSSDNVTVIIDAVCEQTGGNWVQSQPLEFTSELASNFRDIANIEGTLKSFSN